MSVLGRPVRIVWALLFFLYELALANGRLAWDVITPGLPPSAGIIRVPTAARTEWEIWLVANAISMTPGTLTLEVDADGDHHLFVHTLYAGDPDAFVAQMAKLERVLLGALR